MIKIKNLAYVLLSLLLVFSACQEPEEELPGAQPSLNAGPDQDAVVGSTVSLTANATDPDGDPLSYSWTLTVVPSGSSASMTNASNQTATFVPDVVGSYTVQVSVSDNVWDPVTDEVIVTVTEAIGDPPVVDIRDEDNQPISETNNTVTINTPYMLDGSSSFDPDTDPGDLTFTWEVTETPAGSSTASVTAEASDPDMASFVPDVVGEYTISLTVEDPEGNAATETVTIVADAEPVLISSNISEDRTLENVFDDPALPDYRVTTSITANAVLTVSPGVTIEFAENAFLTIASGGGALIADAEADDKIVFTSANLAGSIRWGGIYFSSQDSRNILDQVEVNFAGGSNMTSFSDFVDVPANIGLGQGAKVAITNTTITESGGYGIYIRFGELTAFSSNIISNNTTSGVGLPINVAGIIDAATVFTDNTESAVEIFGSTLTEDISLVSLNADQFYYASGSILANADLTLEAGVEIRSDEDVFVTISDDGVFIANGTETEKVVMTAFDEENPWGGIKMASTSSRNSINHAAVSFTGGIEISEFSDFVDVPAAIGIYGGGDLQLTNSTISDGEGYGIYNRYGTLSTFDNNSFVRNGEYGIALEAERVVDLDANTSFEDNTKGAVEIFGGSLDDAASTWVALKDGAKYVVTSGITINQQLTIEAGAQFTFDNNVPFEVEQSGSLIAEGTAGSIIVFTSLSPGVFNWRGILIDSSTGNNVLDYVEVSHGGSSKYDFDSFVDALTNIGVGTNATVNITNSVIRDSGNYGIYSDGTVNANVEDAPSGNTFADNPGGNLIL